MTKNFLSRGLYGDIHPHLIDCPKPFQIAKNICVLEKVFSDITRGRLSPDEEAKLQELWALKKNYLLLLGRETEMVTRSIYRGEHFRTTPLFAGEQPLGVQKLTLADFVSFISLPHDCGTYLFLILKRLQCNRILELGTGFGISASYFLQALTMRGGFLDTIEGYEVCIRHNSIIFSHFPSHCYKIWHGDTQVIMPALVENNKYDLVFLDASHLVPDVEFQIECAMASFSSGGMLVIDDIDWSDPMRVLWQNVKKRKDVAYTVEVNHKLLPRLGIALKT